LAVAAIDGVPWFTDGEYLGLSGRRSVFEETTPLSGAFIRENKIFPEDPFVSLGDP